jgi:hypothetical protein
VKETASQKVQPLEQRRGAKRPDSFLCWLTEANLVAVARKLTRLEILVADMTGQCRICEMGRRNLKLLVDKQAANDPSFPADTFNFVLEHLERSICDAQGLVEHYADDGA